MTAAPSDTGEESSVPKGNVLLRDFYLQRYQEIHGDRGSFPPSMTARQSPRMDPMAERFVDWNVEQFLSQVEESMASLKARLADLESAREQIPGSEAVGAGERQRLKAAAAEVAADAAKLLRMISMIIWNVKADGSDASQVRPTSDFLRAELDFLRNQVRKAEDSVNDLFLEPTHTVTVRELRGDNVLSQLKSIEVMSKQIVKKL